MQMSLNKLMVDDEVMADPSSKKPSPRKILIGRRPRGILSSRNNAGHTRVSTPLGPPLGPKQQPTDGQTASPLRGPNRFIVCNSRTPEIERRVDDFMVSMSSSPKVADKENRPLQKNILAQEFSPSPVKRVRRGEEYNPQLNNSLNTHIEPVSQGNRVTSTLVRPATIRPVSVRLRRSETLVEEPTLVSEVQVSPVEVEQLAPRQSDAFQQTPAVFKNNPQKEAKARNARGKKRRDPEPNPTEDIVPVQSNNVQISDSQDVVKVSALSGVVPAVHGVTEFKKPVAPPLKSTKTTTENEVVDELSSEGEATISRYLQSWRPVLRKGKLYLEGNLLDLDSTDLGYSGQLWVTSKISKRITAKRVATKGGTEYVLEGNLVVRIPATDLTSRGKTANFQEDGIIPQFILDRFLSGFPENWEKLIQQWIRFNDKKQQDSISMDQFSSLLMNNMTTQSVPVNLTNNLSSISMVNSSRFQGSSGKILTLTLGASTNVSIVGGEEEGPRFQVIGRDDRSRSPLTKLQSKSTTEVDRSRIRKQSQLAQIDEEVPSSEQRKEHRSRSKTVRANMNSDVDERNTENNIRQLPVDNSNLTKVQDKTKRQDQTITQQDFSLLRAKTYEHTAVVGKKKNYRCHFCEFLSPIFTSLKQHLKDNHLAAEECSQNTSPKLKNGMRSQSDESQLTPKIPDGVNIAKKRRSSFSPSKVHDKGKISTKPGDSPEERGEARGGRSQQNKERQSVSPMQKATTESKSDEEVSPKTSRINSKRRTRRSQESKRPPSLDPTAEKQSTVKGRTPGLGLFTCFVCDYNTDKPGEFTKHVATPKHRKQAKIQRDSVSKSDRVKFLCCDPCQYNTDQEAEFKKHIKTKKHEGNMEAVSAMKKADEIQTDVTQADDPATKVSRYGRNIKKNKALTRESCVYNTPPEENGNIPTKRSVNQVTEEGSERTTDQNMIEERTVDVIDQGKGGRRRKPVVTSNMKENSNLKKSDAKRNPGKSDEPQSTTGNDKSLRRTILDPFKKASKSSVRTEVSSSTDKSEEALRKIKVNPKTIKERQNNAKAMTEYNKDHEDDLFGDVGGSKESRKNLLKASTKTLLDDTDSESENEISVHSARTPVAKYMTSSRETEKTPGDLKSSSPVAPSQTGFQRQAYIQKKLAEKEKDARHAKKHRLKSALVPKVTSRSKMDALVDQSSRVINSMTQKTIEEEDNDAEDWFNDSGDDRLACDPGAGLLGLYGKLC